MSIDYTSHRSYKRTELLHLFELLSLSINFKNSRGEELSLYTSYFNNLVNLSKTSSNYTLNISKGSKDTQLSTATPLIC